MEMLVISILASRDARAPGDGFMQFIASFGGLVLLQAKIGPIMALVPSLKDLGSCTGMY